MLKIVRYDVRHNHGVTPDEARLYPRNRRLTQSQLAVVEDLLETTQENNVVKEFIENELQCLTTSVNRAQFFRRLHCLTSLIEFWRNGVDVDIVPRDNRSDNICGFEGASAGDPPPASAFSNTPTGRRFHDAQGSPGTMRFSSFPENSACEFGKDDDEYELKPFDNRRLDFSNLRNAWS
ncbi:unnamed protein product [Schistocephalus solidus]|uniref:Uncharacterized protein n=1 Tax=Schistocephalus solidus TaxID=70667 RepID=A0A183S7H8_SCHSO|nr:unnamed protein product [Schistocephalus solidus]